MNKVTIDRALIEQAVAAINLAQDNLRPHGDNCFLHDDGEYNSCFCGLDSLTQHLQTVTETLAMSLAEPAVEPLSDDLRDMLVAISAAIADQDDRAAQAMIREILSSPQPPAEPAPVPLLSDDEIVYIRSSAFYENTTQGVIKFARDIEQLVRRKAGL